MANLILAFFVSLFISWRCKELRLKEEVKTGQTSVVVIFKISLFFLIPTAIYWILSLSEFHNVLIIYMGSWAVTLINIILIGFIVAFLFATILDLIIDPISIFLLRTKSRVMRENLLKINLRLVESRLFEVQKAPADKDIVKDERHIVYLFSFFSWIGVLSLIFLLFRDVKYKLFPNFNDKQLLFNKLREYPNLESAEIIELLEQIYLLGDHELFDESALAVLKFNKER